MSIYSRARDAAVVFTRPAKSKRPHTDLKTMDHVLHELWSERAGSPGYDKEEKRLWLALQRFVEEKGGVRAPVSEYLR